MTCLMNISSNNHDVHLKVKLEPDTSSANQSN